MKRATLFLVAIGLIAAPAFADVGRRTDQRDTKGPMDIRRIGHAHGTDAEGKDTIRHTIRSHNWWRSRMLSCAEGKCRSMFNVSFDKNRDGDAERLVQIYRRNRKLHALVTRFSDECTVMGTVCTGGSRRIGQARVWRPNRRSIAFEMPVSWLGRSVKRYWWSVNLFFFRNEPCPERSGEAPESAPRDYYCSDVAPQAVGSDSPGWLKHRL